MKIGYYPGCSLESSSKEYSKSLLAVAEKCGIIPEEIKGWSCCGASAAHNLNHDLGIVLPARTLAIAEEQGFTEILVPCAACYRRLAAAQYEVTTNEETHKKVESYLELKFSGKIKILSVIEFLQKYIAPVVDQYIVNNLSQKIACYYGCLLARPIETSKLKRTEDPLEMESILEKTGAKLINWAFKTECCGASLSVSSTTIVAKLSGRIVENAVDCGAESIVVACPMCHMNLDMRRPEIKKQIKKDLDIPVLFITQVLGLSMGIPADMLGLNHHFVSTEKVILSIVKKEA